MAGRPPEDVVPAFLEDVKAGIPNVDLCAKYHKASSTIKEWRQFLGVPSRPKLVFEDRATKPSEEDVEKTIAWLNDNANLFRARYAEQNILNVRIEDDLPIGLAFCGDLHYGAEGVNYKRLHSDFKTLGETEGLWFQGTGDYLHNPKVTAADKANLYRMAVSNKDTALSMIKKVFTPLKGRTVSLLTGCHDARDKEEGGDYTNELCDYLDCANLWYGGLVRLTIGKQLYEVVVRHKYKGESGLNKTNAHRKMYDNLYPGDIIALAHLHNNELEETVRGEIMGKNVVYVRSSSYMDWDEFGQKVGGFSSVPGVPIVILWPNEKRMLPFSGLHMADGMAYLKYLREQAQK